MRNTSYYLVVFVLLILVFGGTLWYVGRTGSHIGPAFDLTRQFVPKGTVSLEVPQALALFHFPAPLPFFDERNVVQSLDLPLGASAATSSSKAAAASTTSVQSQNSATFLSYRIFGQNKQAIRNSFIEYFKNMGWEISTTNTRGDKPVAFFLRQTRQQVLVTLLDVAHVPGTQESAIVAALSMQTFPPSH